MYSKLFKLLYTAALVGLTSLWMTNCASDQQQGQDQEIQADQDQEQNQNQNQNENENENENENIENQEENLGFNNQEENNAQLGQDGEGVNNDAANEFADIGDQSLENQMANQGGDQGQNAQMFANDQGMNQQMEPQMAGQMDQQMNQGNANNMGMEGAQPMQAQTAAPTGGGKVLYVRPSGSQLYQQPGSNSMKSLEQGDHPLVYAESEYAKTSDGYYVPLRDLSEQPIGRRKTSAIWR